MANKMRSVLNNIISDDQKGFLKGRYLEENTRLIYDIMQYYKDSNKSGILLLIDFEKAFDSIEWPFIRKVLKRYNFGENYIKWFNIIYKNAQSCVINNGHYSEFFQLERGCRQGDPWSPYLFILSIEPLSEYIKQNTDIKGMKFGSREIKIGHYADDTFLTLENNNASIRAVIQSFTNFEKISGLKINIDKTQVINIGKHDQATNCSALNIPYSTKFKLLGINFSTNLNEMEDLNFKPKLTSIQKIIRLYQWRGLSMAGRITIVKMHILPNLVHLLTVLPSPKEHLLNEIKSTIMNFIWDNKRPKIQYHTLVQEYHMGGQKMLHIESFCKASKLSWIKKIYNTPEKSTWKIVTQTIFKEKHLPILFECTVERIKRLARSVNNIFWKEVLNTWSIFRQMTDAEKSEEDIISNLCIWNSEWIKNNNLLARKTHFMSNGLIYFKDLYDYQNKIFKTRQEIITSHNIVVSQFDFMCLSSSIPLHVKDQIKKYQEPTVTHNQGELVWEICSQLKPTRYSYKKLIKKLSFDIKAKAKWENVVGRQIIDTEWHKIFTLPGKISLNTPLRIFQYKIIHQILPTNKLLHIYRLRDNPWCDLCPNVIENLEHLFHLCPQILNLWHSIAVWLAPELDLFRFINTENILLGTTEQTNVLENSIILNIKKYIYNIKCREAQLNIIGVQMYIRHVMILETNIKNEQRKNSNIQKWSKILQKLNMLVSV